MSEWTFFPPSLRCGFSSFLRGGGGRAFLLLLSSPSPYFLTELLREIVGGGGGCGRMEEGGGKRCTSYEEGRQEEKWILRTNGWWQPKEKRGENEALLGPAVRGDEERKERKFC